MRTRDRRRARGDGARAGPADVAYRVRQGDTIELIAAEFYGDHARTVGFVAEENKLKPPYKIYPGERLKIPVTREIATAKGDTFDVARREIPRRREPRGVHRRAQSHAAPAT